MATCKRDAWSPPRILILRLIGDDVLRSGLRISRSKRERILSKIPVRLDLWAVVKRKTTPENQCYREFRIGIFQIRNREMERSVLLRFIKKLGLKLYERCRRYSTIRIFDQTYFFTWRDWPPEKESVSCRVQLLQVSTSPLSTEELSDSETTAKAPA